jgi:hypothetical protein
MHKIKEEVLSSRLRKRRESLLHIASYPLSEARRNGAG